MKQLLTQVLTTGNKISTVIRRLTSYYWIDHSGNNLTDHNGNKIIFIKRGPFINSSFINSFLYYSWKDNSNNILTNHDGNKIIFKKRSP